MGSYSELLWLTLALQPHELSLPLMWREGSAVLLTPVSSSSGHFCAGTLCSTAQVGVKDVLQGHVVGILGSGEGRI